MMAKKKAANLLQDVQQRQLLKKRPPSWLVESVQYLTMMGSVAYGVADAGSDWDIYGFCIPPRRVVFPHTQGWIPGFEAQPEAFNQWQEHHVQDPDASGGHGREYDFTVYNIVQYFKLTMDASPNMVDSLFTPERCVLYQTPLAVHLREHRHLFLSKKCWHSFKGYAWQQRTKMSNRSRLDVVGFLDTVGLDYRDFKGELTAHAVQRHMTKRNEEVLTSPGTYDHLGEPLYRLDMNQLERLKHLLVEAEANIPDGKRAEGIQRWGFDLKFAYHLVRLVFEVEQILEEQDLDLTRARETLKAIRAGEWTEKALLEFFSSKVASLEKLYDTSKLRHRPDCEAIKSLLLECLEMHYGSLDKCVVEQDAAVKALREINDVLQRSGRAWQ